MRNIVFISSAIFVLLFTSSSASVTLDSKDFPDPIPGDVIYIINQSGIEVKHAINYFRKECDARNIDVIQSSKPKEGLNIFITTFQQAEQNGKSLNESYSISGEENKITIAAADKRALIYAFQSLSEQLFLQNTPVHARLREATGCRRPGH